MSELGDGVEERLYPAMTWVCDQKTVPMFTESQRRREGLFWPLFQYIQVTVISLLTSAHDSVSASASAGTSSPIAPAP